MRNPKQRAAWCVQAKAALVGACLALVGCGGGASSVEHAPMEPPLDLYWSIDEMNVRGDEVRLGGELMVDERAREVDLADVCTKRPVGRGLWTRNRLVWWVSPTDIAGAMSCAAGPTKGLKLAARRHASHAITLVARNGTGFVTTVGLAADDVLVGVPRIDLRLEGADTVISVEADAPDALHLSMGHDVVGPTVSDHVAEFRLPTETVVRAALHGGRIGIASSEVRAGARLQLFINGQEVAPPPPPEEEAPEESDDRGG